MNSIIVFYILTLSPTLNMSRVLDMSSAIDFHCPERYERITVAIAYLESGFDPDIVGPTGDVGLFQFNPRYYPRKPGKVSISDQVEEFCAHLQDIELEHGRRFPGTWWAVHHSKTPKVHLAYVNRILVSMERFDDTCLP